MEWVGVNTMPEISEGRAKFNNNDQISFSYGQTMSAIVIMSADPGPPKDYILLFKSHYVRMVTIEVHCGSEPSLSPGLMLKTALRCLSSLLILVK